MTRDLLVTTADVILAFQDLPGNSGAQVIDCGEILVDGVADPLKPQSGGLYTFKLPPGETCTFHALSTKYLLQHQDTETFEFDRDDAVVLSCWRVLGDLQETNVNKQTVGGFDTFRFVNPGTAALQRRLQHMGYYRGLVDDKTGPLTEHAVLGFQADHGLRTDAIVGPKTRGKIDEVMENDYKSGDGYILRVPLLGAKRAPSDTDPVATDRRPSGRAPDVDDRGSSSVKISTGDSLVGPVVPVRAPRKGKEPTDLRVNIERRRLGPGTAVWAESDDESVVSVATVGALPGDPIATLRLKGEGQGVTKVALKEQKTGARLLDLNVVSRKLTMVKVQPYFVVLDFALPKKRSFWNSAFNVVNRIWIPHGVYFHFLPWQGVQITPFGTHGKLPDSKGTGFDRVVNAINASADKKIHTKKNVVTLLVIREHDDPAGSTTFGLTWDRTYGSKPYGISVRDEPNASTVLRAEDSTGMMVAHELGHFVGLAHLVDFDKWIHAENDPGADDEKCDIWTLGRLMCGGNTPHRRRERWAQKAGYGRKMCGCLITERNLPQEPTDGEVAKALSEIKSGRIFK